MILPSKGLLPPTEAENSRVNDTWPRGYKTFFLLNSTEQEISTAHKN